MTETEIQGARYGSLYCLRILEFIKLGETRIVTVQMNEETEVFALQKEENKVGFIVYSLRSGKSCTTEVSCVPRYSTPTGGIVYEAK